MPIKHPFLLCFWFYFVCLSSPKPHEIPPVSNKLSYSCCCCRKTCNVAWKIITFSLSVPSVLVATSPLRHPQDNWRKLSDSAGCASVLLMPLCTPAHTLAASPWACLCCSGGSVVSESSTEGFPAEGRSGKERIPSSWRERIKKEKGRKRQGPL